MYDLVVAPPHVPDDVRHTPDTFAHYRDGYTWALVMALRVLDAATRRYELVVQTKRLETRRRRQGKA